VARKITAGLLLGLGAAGFVLLLGWMGLLEAPEFRTYDWRVQRNANSAAVGPDIVLVEITDTTLRDLAPLIGRWPWPRVALAMAVDFLSRAPAKVIAVDLSYLERDNRLAFKYGEGTLSGEDSDGAFVESVAKAGNVLMLADAVDLGTVGGDEPAKAADWPALPFRLGPAIEERPLVTPPYPELTKAAAGLGHNLLTLDTDGRARRIAPFIRVRDRYLPSFGVAAALQASGVRPGEVVLEANGIRVRDRIIPLVPTPVPDLHDAKKQHDQQTMLINYRAPKLVNGERSIRMYEMRHVLASEEQVQEQLTPMLDPALFKDKIVFIGMGASGLVDVFTTPFGDVMPGIQLHASVADSILSNRFIRPAAGSVRVWTTMGFALLVALLATTFPYVAAAAGGLVVAGGWTWFSLSKFGDGLWLNMSEPLLGCAFALFAGTAYQYFVEGAEKRVVKKLFGRYVSKDVYQQLISNPELAQLGGKRREMTVLFSDIRGFTTVTEKGVPEQLVAQLNEYFSRMVDVVFRHGGTIDKFVGDMVMALFGAPVDDPDHAEHAVAAAVDMCAELHELNRKWKAEGRPQLDIGVGINSGGMIAGNIGSSSIMSYTVIGDNVNLGSRLESLNKEYKTRIIISDATRSLLHGSYEIRPLGDVVVKGKTRPVAIFEVVVPSPLQAASEEVTR
jgi:adenylate cyclase